MSNQFRDVNELYRDEENADGQDSPRPVAKHDIDDLRARVESGFGLNHNQAAYVFSKMDAATHPVFQPAPTVLIIPSENATRLYDPTTGIQYTLRHFPADGKISEYMVPVGFVALNAAATGDNDSPHIYADGDEALDWWRQIVAHYREQNRIAGWQYQQAVGIEKKAGDILRQWTEAKNDGESYPSPSPSEIPF